MRLIAALIAAIALAFTADAPIDTQKEMSQLQGEWSMVSGQADGQPMPDAMVATGKRVTKDGVTTITINGEILFKAKFTIDPSKTPKAIDYAMIEGPTNGKTQLGISE